MVAQRPPVARQASMRSNSPGLGKLVQPRVMNCSLYGIFGGPQQGQRPGTMPQQQHMVQQQVAPQHLRSVSPSVVAQHQHHQGSSSSLLINGQLQQQQQQQQLPHHQGYGNQHGQGVPVQGADVHGMSPARSSMTTPATQINPALMSSPHRFMPVLGNSPNKRDSYGPVSGAVGGVPGQQQQQQGGLYVQSSGSRTQSPGGRGTPHVHHSQQKFASTSHQQAQHSQSMIQLNNTSGSNAGRRNMSFGQDGYFPGVDPNRHRGSLQTRPANANGGGVPYGGPGTGFFNGNTGVTAPQPFYAMQAPPNMGSALQPVQGGEALFSPPSDEGLAAVQQAYFENKTISDVHRYTPSQIEQRFQRVQQGQQQQQHPAQGQQQQQHLPPSNQPLPSSFEPTGGDGTGRARALTGGGAGGGATDSAAQRALAQAQSVQYGIPTGTSHVPPPSGQGPMATGTSSMTSTMLERFGVTPMADKDKDKSSENNKASFLSEGGTSIYPTVSQVGGGTGTSNQNSSGMARLQLGGEGLEAPFGGPLFPRANVPGTNNSMNNNLSMGRVGGPPASSALSVGGGAGSWGAGAASGARGGATNGQERMSMVSIREKLNRIYELVGGDGTSTNENTNNVGGGAGEFDSPARKKMESVVGSEMRDLLNNSPDAGLLETPDHAVLGSAVGMSAPPLFDPVSSAVAAGGAPGGGNSKNVSRRVSGTSQLQPRENTSVGVNAAAVSKDDQLYRSGPISTGGPRERLERQPQTISDDLRSQIGGEVKRTASATISNGGGPNTTNNTNNWSSNYIAGPPPPESPPKRQHDQDSHGCGFSTDISPIPNEPPSSAARSQRSALESDHEQPSRLSFRGPVIDGFGFAKITSPNTLRNTAPQPPPPQQAVVQTLQTQKNASTNATNGTNNQTSSSEQNHEHKQLVRRLTFLEKYALQSDGELQQLCEKLGLVDNGNFGMGNQNLLPRQEMLQRLEEVYCNDSDVMNRIPTSLPPQRQVSSGGSLNQNDQQPARMNSASGKRRRMTDEFKMDDIPEHSKEDPLPEIRTKAPPPSRLPGSRLNSAAPTPSDIVPTVIMTASGPPVSAPPKKRPGEPSTTTSNKPNHASAPSNNSKRNTVESSRPSHRKSDVYLRPEHHECPIPLDPAVVDRLREAFNEGAQGELTLDMKASMEVCLHLGDAVGLELTEVDVVRRFSRFDFEGGLRLPFSGFCALCASLDIVVPLDEAGPDSNKGGKNNNKGGRQGDVEPFISSSTPFVAWDSDLRSCVEMLPGPDPTTEHLLPLTHRRFCCRTGPWDDERPRDAPREEEAYSFNALRICHSQIALPTLEHVRRELRRYQSVAKNSDNLIPFAGVFEGPYDFVFLQEKRPAEVELPVFWHVYAQEHEEQLIRTFGNIEGLTAHIVRQLLEALICLHDSDLVHGGVCPSSVYASIEEGEGVNKNLVDVHVALAEPGLGGLFRQRDGWAGRGVLEALHEAPERMMCNEEMGNLLVDAGAKADIWSVGCLFYSMLTGKPVPYSSLDESHLDVTNDQRSSSMINDLADLDAGGFITGEAKSLCSSMLDRSAKFRPSARQCLTHPWFSQKPTAQTKSQDPATSIELVRCWQDLAEADFRLRGAIRAIAWELQFPISSVLGQSCVRLEDLADIGGLADETVQAVRQMLATSEPTDENTEIQETLPACAIQLVLQTSLAIKLSEIDEVISDAFAAFSPAEGEDFVAELPAPSIVQALEVGDENAPPDLEAARAAVAAVLEEAGDRNFRFEEVREQLIRCEDRETVLEG